MDTLTRTELEIVKWAATDLDYDQIEARTHHCRGWMRVHMHNIARKLEVTEKYGDYHRNRRRIAIVQKARELGILPSE